MNLHDAINSNCYDQRLHHNIRMINHDAIHCGHYNAQQYNKDSIVHSSGCMWHWFVAAAKSFAQCIHDYETVQKPMQSAEISTNVDGLNCLESACNAFIINEIYTVDNQGNTEISANTNECCGS